MNLQKPCLTFLTAMFFAAMATAAPVVYVPTSLKTPALPPREFRAAWVATVANIDWPSKPGLPVAEQKTELLAILDRAAKLNLNAIVLQVRPACDAIYKSSIEPWSYYVTGAMGKAPEPFYDPLTFAVEEAHKRGLELHAWFNPYRAGIVASKGPISANHISKTRPDLVRHYGSYLWLDPGEKEVQDYTLSVVMDVVQRYDVDGIHFDDYFYPYRELNAQKQEMDFPDEASWMKFAGRWRTSREDWRRENVNTLIRRVYASIKEVKPWVKFGVSPFGIWQPGYPPQIKGFNAFAVLYCDSRKWLQSGWLDYCAPQLYWSIAFPDTSYPVLLKWWNQENSRHRNLWPGLNSDKVGHRSRTDDTIWTADEIIKQIEISRHQDPASPGVIHWSMKSLMQNRGDLDTALTNRVYGEKALIPASPWLERHGPGKPRVQVTANGGIYWNPAEVEKMSSWVIQTRTNGRWHTSIVPGSVRELSMGNTPDVVAITAIDRCGLASSPSVLKREAAVQQ